MTVTVRSIAVGGHGAGAAAESVYISYPQAQDRQYPGITRVCETSKPTTSNTPPPIIHPSQAVPPTRDQEFKCVGLGEPFLSKPPLR